MSALIETHHLNFSYKLEGHQVHALKNVNLTIPEGEFVAIQGPSGSGKSTFLYVLGALLRPDSGTVLFSGKNLTQLSNDELAQLRNQYIGFIFQQFHLLPRMTVMENVCLPIMYQSDRSLDALRKSRDRARELIRQLGLDHVVSHMPNQLSGGQQQRVAIARALMGDTRLILADEPTGNLDTENSAQVMQVLKSLNKEGKTVVLITHNPEIASQCDTTYMMKDGFLQSKTTHARGQSAPLPPAPEIEVEWSLQAFKRMLLLAKNLVPLASQNLRLNIVRSALTMLGIVIGIAGVMSMLTLGTFTKKEIMKTYESLGSNKLVVYGYRNWRLSAKDKVPTLFQGFDWEKDLLALKRIFPEIVRLSPILSTKPEAVSFAGKVLTESISVLGVNSDHMGITNRKLLLGVPFSPYHIAHQSAVCMIGYDIATRLFSTSPLGKLLFIKSRWATTPMGSCRVIGVFTPQSSNNDWESPNTEIHIPHTYFPYISPRWESRISAAALTVDQHTDIENTSTSIKTYFQQKYGRSGQFHADASAILLEQLKKFVNIFSILLAGVALMSLIVGGMGITNMMLISVVERFKEIGLRKALGATDSSIRTQFLVESVIICLIAGVVGLILGIFCYEAIIFAGSRVFPKTLQFEWTIEPIALALSFVAILGVGLLSGLFPALKAERLSVIEALRSE